MAFAMTYCCERCRRVTELYHCSSVDQYLCDDCLEQLADEQNIDDGAAPECDGTWDDPRYYDC